MYTQQILFEEEFEEQKEKRAWRPTHNQPADWPTSGTTIVPSVVRMAYESAVGWPV